MRRVDSPTLHTAGLAAAERAMNALLSLSPHSGPDLARLAGSVLALECTRPALTVYISSDDQGQLSLRGVFDGEVSTRVQGSLEDFTELARAADPAATLINGGLQLHGSSGTLLEMQRIFSELDVDWEAPLVDALGDVAGHQLAQMLRAALSWSRQSRGNLERQLREFALEEARLAPAPAALEDFYADVRALAQRGERLEKQLQKTRMRLESLKAN